MNKEKKLKKGMNDKGNEDRTKKQLKYSKNMRPSNVMHIEAA